MKDIKSLTESLLGDLEEEQTQTAPPIGSAAGTGSGTAPKETKSRRMQLLVKPSTAAKLKAAADAGGLSVNDLINRIFEEWLQGR